ncbi:hypothetical protein [Paenibacillus luteus]|uniref:hypothetical protein n=1 Tax=Paenibacillus luteus TaxID=2545753 RepID=UPI001144F6F5|nr:hypothetical protein [Paenibacillus luteus]
MKIKLGFYAVIALLFIFVGIPAIENIGGGFQKDVSNMSDPNKLMNMNINPNASGMELFVKMTPKGSEAISKEIDGIGSFMESLLTIVIILIICASAFAFFNYRAKVKEENGRRYGRSRYNDRW